MGEFKNSSKERKKSKIASLREKRGWTQQYLADITGYSRVYINKLEQRKIPNPSVAAYKKLSYALGVPIDELIKEL